MISAFLMFNIHPLDNEFNFDSFTHSVRFVMHMFLMKIRIASSILFLLTIIFPDQQYFNFNVLLEG
jgi:hypothetical protein